MVHSTAAAAAAAAKSLQSCPTLCDPIGGSPLGSPSLGFSRQEHWSGLPFPSPWNVLLPLIPDVTSEDIKVEFSKTFKTFFSHKYKINMSQALT